MALTTFQVRIRQIRLEGHDTLSFELISSCGQPLPGFTAGAHIDVHLPNSVIRSYSLMNGPNELDHYRIAVKLNPDSRGGSAWLHRIARVGMTLEISAPTNDFEMVESGSTTILIAGGIGITPMISMIAHQAHLGKHWELHYCARSAAHMAFYEELKYLAARGGGVLHTYLDDSGRTPIDLKQIVYAAAPDAHLYCCGPTSMLEAFIAETQNRPQGNIHFERFSASQTAASEGGYDVHLSRDGRTFTIPEGNSILDVLLDAGLDIPYACSQGICGSCLTAVLDGIPDHRDDFLSTEQREANDSIVICCSGSRSPILTLDL